MTACEHIRQVHNQTYIDRAGEWVPSTLQRFCIDCGGYWVETPATAFVADNARRRQMITRDDRPIAHRGHELTCRLRGLNRGK